jgi:hypothetical protein
MRVEQDIPGLGGIRSIGFTGDSSSLGLPGNPEFLVTSTQLYKKQIRDCSTWSTVFEDHRKPTKKMQKRGWDRTTMKDESAVRREIRPQGLASLQRGGTKGMTLP